MGFTLYVIEAPETLNNNRYKFGNGCWARISFFGSTEGGIGPKIG
jgi:hypothetical protein